MHNNKFLFINLAIGLWYDANINQGIAYLSSRLKKHSFDVACLNINTEISPDEFIGKIREFDPSIVGFSCISTQLENLIKYSTELKKYSDNILQIAGGPGPTLDPERFLSPGGLNGVCVGEGEIPLDNLFANLKNNKSVFDTDGFYWLVDGKIRKNPVCQYISDLSSLDFPDYSIFAEESVCRKRPYTDMIGDGKAIAVTISRGCPHKCAYCCASSLKEVYQTSSDYFRVPSVEHAIELVQRKIEMYPEAKVVSFLDDLLISKKTWFKHFAEEYAKKINIPYGLCGRAESLDPEIVKLLSNTGCTAVYVGLEAGNEDFRKRFLNRKYSNKLFIESCALVKKAGMRLITFNMVGFPFETRTELEDTLNLNKEVAPDWGFCSYLFPFKGTKLYEICRDNNMLNENMDIIPYMRPGIKLPPEQERDCIEYFEKITNYLNEQAKAAMGDEFIQ